MDDDTPCRRAPSSLTDDEIREVYLLARDRVHNTEQEIADLFNISRLAVYRIARGLTVRPRKDVP